MLYVRTVDGVFKSCIDTPPPVGEDGWREAIEVRPSIVANRQGYTGHIFDLDKTPVEIVYGTFDILFADRQRDMISSENMRPMMLARERNPSARFDEIVVSVTDREASDAKILLISAATNHDELDLLM